jgi:hypothetical protein
MKKKLLIVLAVVLTLTLLLLGSSGYNSTVLGSNEYGYKTLTMTHYCECGSSGTHACCCCGPSSGVSIGRYYRDEKWYEKLPRDDDMYDVLSDCMNTGTSCFTWPHLYDIGFDKMTDDPDQNPNTPGYHNFNFYRKGAAFSGEVTLDDFERIRDAIDNGWPVALCANFWDIDYISKDGPRDWPPPWGHYIAIKGYQWAKSSGVYLYRYIICTDNYSGSNNLTLSWDDVVNNALAVSIFIIKDDGIEDFEWGNGGDSLSTSGGDIQWSVQASGFSKAIIDKVNKHYGARSARVYMDGTNAVWAQYSQAPLSYIGWHLLLSGGTLSRFEHGDATHVIWVRVTADGSIQYWDGSLHDTYKDITPNTWHYMEIRNIDWTAATYDIYADNVLVKSGTPMWANTTQACGVVRFYSDAGVGTFWVDDIFEKVAALEDFEWGNSGDSLSPSGGDVTWSVTTQGGTSVAEIDMEHKYTGTRSGRVHMDGTNAVWAQYSQAPLSYIGWHLRLDGETLSRFDHGDATHTIWMRVKANGSIEYYDGSVHPTGKTITLNAWHYMEIRNIDWTAATYDIYADNVLVKSGTPMWANALGNGVARWYSDSGAGNFWVDDIVD